MGLKYALKYHTQDMVVKGLGWRCISQEKCQRLHQLMIHVEDKEIQKYGLVFNKHNTILSNVTGV